MTGTPLHPVVGHEGLRSTLTRAHFAAGLPGALLIHGLRGVGKQRLALWLAQLQVCEEPSREGPCGACNSCLMALSLQHPDIHYYFPLPRPKGVAGDRLADALESARIDALDELRTHPVRASEADELRGLYLGLMRGLRRRAHLRPTLATCQVFIIADAEYLVPQEARPEAANALLKLLEEPPPHARFILTSSEPGRLLPTIRSRSVPLHLSPLPVEMVARFIESEGAEPELASWAAHLGMGSIGRALGFLPAEEKAGPLEAMRQRALGIMEAALAPGRGASYAQAVSFSASGARSLVELFSFVEEWLRDVAAVAAGAEHQVLNRLR